MVRIRFHRLVVSPQYGNCGPGDVVSCSEAFARHCVEDLRAAVYLNAPAAPPAEPPAAPAPRRGRRKAA